MRTGALSRHLEALETQLDLCRSLTRQAGKLLRAKRVRPEARNYVTMLLDELSPIQSEGAEVARALQEFDAAIRSAELARAFRDFPPAKDDNPSGERKAPRLAGTGREGDSDEQTVTPAVASVNELALGSAAQRQEVGDAH